ncbi:MAG: toxin-antitoxin system HicB family antitoxin [Firmicutes bacterium]|nr:toxin-antitoxin system HicB family antitoxin [Bacillota bacterium]
MKKRFLLRLDPAVYDALARWAADELRSVNGQIEYLLAEALHRAGRGPSGRPPGNRPGGEDPADGRKGGTGG